MNAPKLKDVELLQTITPRCPVAWAEALVEAAGEWEINRNVRRMNMFVAQCAHETNGFTCFEENLDYTALRLAAVWPGKFAVASRAKIKAPNELALSLEHRPYSLANYIYASRFGNGDEGSGDGWRFRGRGPLMLTFRVNYQLAGDAIGIALERAPHLVAVMPQAGARAAAWYWWIHGCNQAADREALETVTRRIAGSLQGLESRLRWYTKVQNAYHA